MYYTRRERDVVIVQPPSPLSDRALDKILSELTQELAQRRRYCLVFDLRSAPLPSAVQRRKLSEHMGTHDSAIRAQVRGLAVVAPTAVQRGLVTAVFWVSPPPVEYHLCSELDDALRWAEARLAQAHVNS
jgi:hypothetical protein